METRLPTRPLVILTFATGVIDAASFLALGQVFAAMQTGNVVFLGIGTAGAGDAPFLAPLIGLGAFLAGSALAATAVDEAGDAVFLPRWLAREAGLLTVAALLAAIVDPDPGHASAYLLIALLSLTMGLRNTFIRGTAGPNLATTVLNLTLTTATPGAALGAASSADLNQRAAGLGAILLGAIAGALAARSSLPLALLLAAAATLAAALSAASDPGEELAQP
ncbi:MAG TPA: YoaK family protein [Solirubrobacterales bacterium]|nr:YoaK family protein [Solirubrobacterales bacterium]